MYNPKSTGSCGVVDFRTKVNALHLQWIRCYLLDPPAKWKEFLPNMSEDEDTESSTDESDSEFKLMIVTEDSLDSES